MKGSSFGRQSMQNPLQSSMGSALGSTKKGGRITGAGGFNPGASMAGASFGGTMGLSGAVPMNFRGQDKALNPTLGSNPNIPIEDEYIQNLQQQIHFMELELKILKEKVVEDEKKSGIGSLFDDEKSSFQHISLLKQKYQKMRRDFDKKIEELNKVKLDVVGQQFVLDSQINIMLSQNQKIEDTSKQYDRDFKRKNFELEKKFKDVSKQRFDLENELRSMENEFNRENDDNYTNKMTIIKEKEFEEVANTRHKIDTTLEEELIQAKDDELKRLKGEREQVVIKEKANEDLQKLRVEAVELVDKIDDGHVKHELLNIQVREMEDATQYLNDKKEELIEEKKNAEIRNEELVRELKAKEEINEKKMQAKLARDKNPEWKELIARQETGTQHNNELQQKLEDEKKKYDHLLDERLDLDEKKRATETDMEQIKAKLHAYDEQIDALNKKIAGQTVEVDGLNAKVEEASKINKVEDEKFRRLSQNNAALKAKLEFIQAKYDPTSNVKGLNIDDFKQLMTSNDVVNLTVKDFIGRLDSVKQEVFRNMMQ